MKERILIVDDEQDILDLLTAALKSEGYEVLSALDGAEGIKLFKKGKPDLIITDVKMPGKNGLDVLRAVKDSESDVDVIILTGHSDEVTAIDCLRNGAYDYLLKPLEEIDILFATIERAIAKRLLIQKNKHLLKQLEEMAIKDPLTNLYNFRYLHKHLDEEISRCERYGRVTSVFLLDLDHFKSVNDTYGRLFGDHVLRKVSELMRCNKRMTDSLYRYGGEEFFIILPETSAKEAMPVAERFMDVIRNHCFQCDGQRTNITISIGGAFCPGQAKDKTELIRNADQALYKAKETGRDRVVFFSGTDKQ